MKKDTSEGLSQKQRAELKALANLPDESIDTSDIPEILDWSGARRGLLYRPIKKQITLRLDADVISWFKARAPLGRGYQTEINRVLREHAGQPLRQDFSPEEVVEALVNRGGPRLELHRDSTGKPTFSVDREHDDKGFAEMMVRVLFDKVSEDAKGDLDSKFTWWNGVPETARDELFNWWERLFSQCFNLGWSMSSTVEKWAAVQDRGVHREIEANVEDNVSSRLRSDH